MQYVTYNNSCQNNVLIYLQFLIFLIYFLIGGNIALQCCDGFSAIQQCKSAIIRHILPPS